MKKQSEFYDFTTAKEEYREFCETTKADIRVFAQPWYLDAVCDSIDDWRVILVKNNDQIVAAFPFGYKKDKRGMWRINNPWQAPRLGIWMDYGSITRSGEREFFENKIVEEIIDKLPPYDVFQVAFDERLQNWQQFYRSGFCQTTHYSYIISDICAENQELLSNMNASKRNLISKSKKKYLNKNGISKEEYWEFFITSYETRDRVAQYDKEPFFRLHDAAVNNSAMKIYVAQNSEEKIVGVLFTLKDDRRCYNMFSNFDATAKPSAQAWLNYQAAVDAMISNRVYDFEGSMIPGIARFNNEFGAIKEPYFVLTKYSNRYTFLYNLRETFRAGKRMLINR